MAAHPNIRMVREKRHEVERVANQKIAVLDRLARRQSSHMHGNLDGFQDNDEEVYMKWHDADLTGASAASGQEPEAESMEGAADEEDSEPDACAEFDAGAEPDEPDDSDELQDPRERKIITVESIAESKKMKGILGLGGLQYRKKGCVWGDTATQRASWRASKRDSKTDEEDSDNSEDQHQTQKTTSGKMALRAKASFPLRNMNAKFSKMKPQQATVTRSLRPPRSFGRPCLNPLCDFLAHSSGVKGKMEGSFCQKVLKWRLLKKVIAEDEEVSHGNFCERLLQRTGEYKPK